MKFPGFFRQFFLLCPLCPLLSVRIPPSSAFFRTDFPHEIGYRNILLFVISIRVTASEISAVPAAPDSGSSFSQIVPYVRFLLMANSVLYLITPSMAIFSARSQRIKSLPAYKRLPFPAYSTFRSYSSGDFILIVQNLYFSLSLYAPSHIKQPFTVLTDCLRTIFFSPPNIPFATSLS